jgi:hypothetical protein
MFPATTDRFADPVDGDDADAALVRPLMAGTRLESAPLRWARRRCTVHLAAVHLLQPHSGAPGNDEYRTPPSCTGRACYRSGLRHMHTQQVAFRSLDSQTHDGGWWDLQGCVLG